MRSPSLARKLFELGKLLKIKKISRFLIAIKLTKKREEGKGESRRKLDGNGRTRLD